MEVRNGSGDGAYDLFHVEGTPAEVGAAIAASLAACDLYSGQRPSAVDAGEPIYLTVRIQVVADGIPFEEEEET